MLKQYVPLIYLILGILFGILVGISRIEVLVRLLVTFHTLFASFLSFIIPLVIFAFTTKGIADLGNKSSNLLGITIVLSYSTTVVAGILVYFINNSLFPVLLRGKVLESLDELSKVTSSYISLEMPPLMAIMTALLLSFILGIGIASFKSESLKNVLFEFHTIIEYVLFKAVVPLLPIHLAGLFAIITYTGEIVVVASTFIKIFVVVIIFHILFIFIKYVVTGILSKKNPFLLIKNMMPAYFRAIGTKPSDATNTLTKECIKSNGVKLEVAEFIVSLCSNIHLSGSMITITSCSMAVMFLSGIPFEFMNMMEFILIVGVMMVASPGLPVIMAAIGMLQVNLGFNNSMIALLIALYLTQDSFGTAYNVTVNGATAVIVDTFTD